MHSISSVHAESNSETRWLAELAERAESNSMAESMLDDIEAFSLSPEARETDLNTSTLRAILKRVALQLEDGFNTTLPPVLVYQAQLMILRQTLCSVLRRVLESTLDSLLEVDTDFQFWNSRLVSRRHLRDFIETGPLVWFRLAQRPLSRLVGKLSSSNSASTVLERPPSPRRSLNVTVLHESSFKPWLNSWKVSGQLKTQQTLSSLASTQKRLRRRAGRLHHALFGLESNSCEDDIEFLSVPLSELCRLVLGLEPIGSNPSLKSVVDDLQRIVDAIPELELRDKLHLLTLRRPGHFQRHWIAYSLLAFSSLVSARYFSIHHEAVTVAFNALAKATKEFFLEHVVIPIRAIRERLFQPRPPSVKKEDVSQERIILEGMIMDFGHSQLDNDESILPAGISRSDFEKQLKEMAKEGDMSMVLHSYQREVSKPLYGLAAGQLLRSIFIQLQKLKIDMTASLVELDVMLEQNEITLELAAIVPAILTLYPLLSLVFSPFIYRTKGNTRHHKRMRMCIRSVQRLLICNYSGENSQMKESVEDSGKILTLVHKLLKDARLLRSRRLMSLSDLTRLERDVSHLVSLSMMVEQKRQFCEYMYQAYRFMAVPE